MSSVLSDCHLTIVGLVGLLVSAAPAALQSGWEDKPHDAAVRVCATSPIDYDADARSATVFRCKWSGRAVALLGANGSGKSTLLRMLDVAVFSDRTVRFIPRPASRSPSFFEDDGSLSTFAAAWRWSSRTPMCSCSIRPCSTKSPSRRCNCAGRRNRYCPSGRRCWNAMQIRHLTRPSALSPFRRREETGRAGFRPGAGSRGVAAGRAHGNARSAQPEPDHRLDPAGGAAKTVITATHHLEIVEDIADRSFLEDGKVQPAALRRKSCRITNCCCERIWCMRTGTPNGVVVTLPPAHSLTFQARALAGC